MIAHAKKNRQGGRGLAAHTSGANCLGAFDVTNLLISSIYRANPAQQSDMTVSAEKIVIMCYEGVGAGKKMEPRIHMTVSFFSVPSICQNFHHGLCRT